MFIRKSNRSKDLTGKVFGKLTVLEDSGLRSNKKIMWSCRCECGSLTNVRSSHLLSGSTLSCGCYGPQSASERAARTEGCGAVKKTHGMSKTRVYAVYRTMLQRCDNPNSHKFKDYGGRGISVCNRWRGVKGFQNFLSDMGETDLRSPSIERIDVNGDYCPGNCKWATLKEQSRNRRNTRTVAVNGKEKLLMDLATESGIPYKVLHQRLSRGWSVERATTQKVRSSDG